MHPRYRTLILFPLLVLGACSSTGRLAEFDLYQKRVIYRPVAECRRMTSSIWVNDPLPEAKTPVTGIAAIFASLIGSAAADAEFRDAVNTDGVARLLSEGIEAGMTERYQGSALRDGEGEADFIIETRLEDVALVSNADGVFLRLRAVQRMLDWRDRSVIFKHRFNEHVPLRFHSTGSPEPAVMTVEGVVSAIELLAMDEAEVQDAVLATAQDAGLILADSFLHAAERAR